MLTSHHDGIKGNFLDATEFHIQKEMLEETLWAVDPLIAKSLDLVIRKEKDAAVAISCSKFMVTYNSFSLMSCTISHSTMVIKL